MIVHIPEIAPAAKRRPFVCDSRVGIRSCSANVSSSMGQVILRTYVFDLIIGNKLDGRVRKYAE